MSGVLSRQTRKREAAVRYHPDDGSTPQHLEAPEGQRKCATAAANPTRA